MDLNDIQEQIAAVTENYKTTLLNFLYGIPVRVDERLEGTNYYVCVSKELFEALKSKSLDGKEKKE